MINSSLRRVRNISHCIRTAAVDRSGSRASRHIYTRNATRTRSRNTQTLPHSGLQWRMRCHAWRKALFWSSSFSPTQVYPISAFSPLRNATSSAHLSAAALNGRHTNTEPRADSHYNVLEFMETSTWHTKHHTQPKIRTSLLSLRRPSSSSVYPSSFQSDLWPFSWGVAQGSRTIKHDTSKMNYCSAGTNRYGIHNQMTRCQTRTPRNTSLFWKETHLTFCTLHLYC